MSLWRQLRHGWRNLRDGVGREQDVVNEVAQYIEEAEAEWRERGLSAEEAKRAARREAGSMAVARERASEYGWENNVKVSRAE
jgi:putative ABC transport system permease protein